MAATGCDPGNSVHGMPGTPFGDETSAAAPGEDDGEDDGDGAEGSTGCSGDDCTPPADPGASTTDGGDAIGSTGASDSGDSDSGDSDSGAEGGESDSSGDPQSESESESSGEDGAMFEPEVCYPGSTESGPVCLALVEMAPYEYPPPFADNYDEPIRYIDIDGIDLALPLSENFLLSEVIDDQAGDYQVVQSHAIEMLQAVRDIVGPLIVREAYRSPEYNAEAGGVVNSRHIFGDAFDLEPVENTAANRQALHDACEAVGAGYVETYNNGRVHCDWRNIPNDPAFYGMAPAANVAEAPTLTGPVFETQLVREGEWMRVEVTRSHPSEGTLSRTWVAYDQDGELLDRSEALQFQLPVGTASVEVNVGNLRTLRDGPVPM